VTIYYNDPHTKSEKEFGPRMPVSGEEKKVEQGMAGVEERKWKK
jgi:hypothetical protein